MQANDTRVAGAVFLAALLAQLPTFDRSIVPMDESHLAAVAMGWSWAVLLAQCCLISAVSRAIPPDCADRFLVQGAPAPLR